MDDSDIAPGSSVGGARPARARDRGAGTAGNEGTGGGAGTRVGLLSPVWAAVPSMVGLALAAPAAVEAFGTAADVREPGYLVPLLLALALLAGGYSLVRLVQLAITAARWDVTARGGVPSRRLMDVHSMHATWVSGVGGSLLLMGALGSWSALDGGVSGLEPGLPLVVTGAVIGVAGMALSRWISDRWQLHVEYDESLQKEARERRLNDPLGRIRDAERRQADITEASRDSRPESDPSS